MKRLLFLFTFALISLFSAKADNYKRVNGYGEFSLPDTHSAEVLQKYIGQRVVMLKDGRAISLSDDISFKMAGFVLDLPYTIIAVKETKKALILTLDDGKRHIGKLKVCKKGYYDSYAINSFASLLLIDKYNKYEADFIAEHTNKDLYNANNEKVATIKSVKFPEELNKYKEELKTPILTIENLLDGKTFEYNGKDFENITKNFGTVLINKNGEEVAKIIGLAEKSYSADDKYYSVQNLLDSHICTMNLAVAKKVYDQVGTILEHPRVITTYQITGIDAKKASKESDCKFRIKDLSTNKIEEYYMKKDMTSSVFASDLSGKYISVLTKVEKPANSSIRYGKTSTISEGNNITRFSYVDNVIDIIIFGNRDEFNFVLKNISANSIKVVWNEAVFVSADGSTSKIMHAGTKYSQREGDQPASTVIKGAKLEDIAVPTCNIRYSSVLGEWVTESMYPRSPDLTGKQIRLMLPIQIKETINEYIFVFDLKYIYNYPERLKY